MIQIDCQRQLLIHHQRNGVCYCYPVSTAKKGLGNRRNSWQTPTGRHRIAALTGAGMPLMTAFIARKPVGFYDPAQHQRDWILTRIIRLSGDQQGINRRGCHDTFQRMIYIHGTHREDLLGTPASHGCIRMANQDIITLFDRCYIGELVYIR